MRAVAPLFALLLTLSSLLPAQQRLSRSLFVQPAADTGEVALLGGRIVAAPPEERSTTLAVLLSAVAPGAGQIYTERYLSLPLIWGFGYYFGREYSRMNDLYHDYGGRFEISVKADTVAHAGDAQLLKIRDFYRDQRDKFAVYLGITYLLNLVDAYVGAAMYGFDVSPDLGGKGAKLRVTGRIR